MLTYLLLVGSLGGCLYILSLVYKLLLFATKKRKLKSKEEFKEEVKKYEG